MADPSPRRKRPHPARRARKVVAGTSVAALLGLSGVMALQATDTAMQAADGATTTVDRDSASTPAASTSTSSASSTDSSSSSSNPTAAADTTSHAS